MKHLISIFIFMMISTSALAQVSRQQSGLDFLNIGPSAASLATSEALTATPSGSASLYFNPAMLVFDTKNSLDLNYTSWIADQVNVFGGLNSVNDKRALTLTFYNARIENIEQRDAPGPPNGEFEVGYLSIGAGYAYKIGPVAAGVAAQYLNEESFTERAGGYAINAGLAAFLFDRVYLGASVLNLGEMQRLIEERTELPAQARFGGSGSLGTFKLPGKNDFYFDATLHADYVLLFDEINSVTGGSVNEDPGFANIGLTLEIAEVVQLQSGYQTGYTERPLKFGAGIITEQVQFNYAIIPFSSGFGAAHSVGIRYFF